MYLRMRKLTMPVSIFRYLLLLNVLFHVYGCSSYRQSIFLKIPDETPSASPTADQLQPTNPTLHVFNQFTLKIFTAKGEGIVDPGIAVSNSINHSEHSSNPPIFVIEKNGSARLPLIGEIQLQELSVRDAEIALQKQYGNFFPDCFVKISVTNNHITVIGNGGVVIPLPNHGITALEAIGMAGDITRETKTNNIRLLRNDQVILLNLSDISNYPQNNIPVKHGDIIYLEPVRRPFVEGFRDASPLFGIVISLLTLIVVFRSTSNP
jgi:polysaccharide export outer membrane protein